MKEQIAQRHFASRGENVATAVAISTKAFLRLHALVCVLTLTLVSGILRYNVFEVSDRAAACLAD